MKNLFSLVAVTVMLIACGSGSDHAKTIQGTWKLTQLDGAEFFDCEKNMTFNFTTEEAKEIRGQKSMKLAVKQGTPACDFPGKDEYDTEYLFIDGKLYIQELKLNEKNLSGVFTIKEILTNKMVIVSLGKTFTFSK